MTNVEPRRRLRGSSVEAAVKSLQGDLKLLLAEVDQYLEQVQNYLSDPSESAGEDLRHKVAYISSLAVAVRSQNYELEIRPSRDEDQRGPRFLRGLRSIISRLHRLSELGLNVVRQFGHLSQPDFLEAYDLEEFFDQIHLGLHLIRPALEQRKLKLAIRICEFEERLDALYADRFQRLIREMDQGLGQPGDRVTTLMMIHYLERIGDFMLEIGEELLFIFLGENLKYSQYLALEAGWKASGRTGQPGAAAGGFQSIWSGRSGCRLGVVRIEGIGEAEGEPVFFKHGPVAKLEKERDNLDLWAGLWPGLPPAVRAFVPAEEGEGSAALVLEYIRGRTLRDMFIDQGGGEEAVRELLRALTLMGGLWKETRRDEETRASFVRQAEKRLGPLRSLYPDLLKFKGLVGGVRIKSIDSLLAEAGRYERDLPAPFAVRIHGDFNLSNIICDESSGAFRFIDLHRSRLSDYSQDLSVMILSILRLPLTGAEIRSRLSQAANVVWTFARDFAASTHDPSLEARLTFGLARSYLTSARFEPRRAVAARFLGYSRHLWDKLAEYGATGRPWSEFRLDHRALYV